MEFKELRKLSGMTQKEFSEYFGMSKRAVEEWDRGARKCPEYLMNLMEYKLRKEKHGQWVREKTAEEDYICTACGAKACSDEERYHLGRYCHECGAKMENPHIHY